MDEQAEFSQDIETIEQDIELFAEQTPAPIKLEPGELLLAKVQGFAEDGSPIVQVVGQKHSLRALSTVSLDASHLGRTVTVAHIAQPQSQWVITGLIKNPLDQVFDRLNQSASGQSNEDIGSEQSLMVDGQKIKIEGKEEIVLQCGESSITLTKAGKILIRGKYLLNRSTGLNRIMGGSVQVN